MPNIIVALNREIARVATLLQKLTPEARDDAKREIRLAQEWMRQNSLGDMQESLAELSEIRGL